MLFPLTLAAATAPSDNPPLWGELDPATATPGTLLFLASLFIVTGVIFLIRDMGKRVRRVRYNSMTQEARLQDGAVDRGGPGANESSDEQVPDAPSASGTLTLPDQSARPHAD